jgi:hypothetical protein
LPPGEPLFDVSYDHQGVLLDEGFAALMEMKRVAEQFGRVMPTEIKLVHELASGVIKADYSYRPTVWSASETVAEWMKQLSVELGARIVPPLDSPVEPVIDFGEVFEDAFSRVQGDLVGLAGEFVEDRADMIFVHAVCDISEGFEPFYRVNGHIVGRYRLNDAIQEGEEPFDVSVGYQLEFLGEALSDVRKLRRVCEHFGRPVPTESKLFYDVLTGRFEADYNYDPIVDSYPDPGFTAEQAFQEWVKDKTDKALADREHHRN